MQAKMDPGSIATSLKSCTQAPLGKEEASGSCCINAVPSNSSIGVPSLFKVKKESCFSADKPVNG